MNGGYEAAEVVPLVELLLDIPRMFRGVQDPSFF